MLTETYHNSPIKNCRTYVHCVKDGSLPTYDHCSRFSLYCTNAVSFKCGLNLSGWQPKPPRRSLRQFLHDVFWA